MKGKQMDKDNYGIVTDLWISKEDKRKNALVVDKANNLESSDDEAVCSTLLTEIECIENVGIQGDDNAKGGERQVTLMDDFVKGWIEQQSTKGLCSSKFRANITIKDLDFTKLHQGALLSVGEAVLQISSINKKCYSKECKLYDEEQTCPIPGGCHFAKVVESGRVKLADRACERFSVNN
jgi:MOSC domain-containing protein YiiM